MMRMASLNSSSSFDGYVRRSWCAKRAVAGNMSWPERWQPAGLPIVVVNPRQVRDFAKPTGCLAKTDRLDAEVIAHFAEAVRPEPRP
jgi:hypothetical protein